VSIFAEIRAENREKTLAFLYQICYYISAIRTGADFPHVAKGLAEGLKRPEEKTKKEKQVWQSYP
jgi:hypothetical protein